MSFTVATQAFTGPFDLLLRLVSQQRVDIGSISVAEVADQYVEEVRRMQDMDLDVASDFLLVASTLLDIKAASLVSDEAPQRSIDFDDDELAGLTPEEAREVLVARLVAYKQFRNAAASLGARAEAEARMHPRTAGPDPEFVGVMPDFLAGITLRGLGVICADVMSRRQEFLLEAEHIAPKRLPVRLAVESVERVVRRPGSHTFSELIGESPTAEGVVVTFLAILELYKRGAVLLEQEENFSDIGIEYVASEEGEAATGQDEEDEYE
ncbi:MAG: segregation/condensation protein A [Atopobiaceae bacterium]|jgi:segregation and condensation protein A|nr:segregation/condensation protein A [Atopobiaceae bacterium]MCH4119262.1 segregation/condensation protein A [Atopobiaceae bacterium]MCI1318065.1 segregation/condensation protein A [Atopobiaceae bacterium]MCI1388478.1 segregation/condensation protein A [Atopobiaceae bacterium]MCI1431977.1 segregation/condensation protein A [Atopobiaceae bacterium]